MPPTKALLVSELFPPAVGGSAVLFDGIYSRLRGADVASLFNMVADPDQEQAAAVAAYQRAGDFGPPADPGAVDAGAPLVDDIEYYLPVSPA